MTYLLLSLHWGNTNQLHPHFSSFSCRFYSYFESAQNDLSREKETTPHAAFRQLDNKKKNYLTARNIKDLTEAQLKRVADMIRPELTEEERILREEL